MDFILALLEAGADRDYTFIVRHPSELEPDYEGINVQDAYDAATACDEMVISFIGNSGHESDFAYVLINEEDEDTLIDCNAEGFVNDFSNSYFKGN